MINRAVEILLVEDNSDNVDLMLRAFRNAQVLNKISVVRNGLEALDFLFSAGRFAQRAPNHGSLLVLLDLILPRLHGLDVLRAIKSEVSTRQIPVIILSNSAEEKDIMQCYRIGAEHFLIKPFRCEEFLEAISRLGMDWRLANCSQSLIRPQQSHPLPQSLGGAGKVVRCEES